MLIYKLYLEHNGRTNEKLKSLFFRLSILWIKFNIIGNNKFNSSLSIIKNLKHLMIIESFNKAVKNTLLLDNKIEICIHESMNCQKECKCQEKEPLINSRLIRTQYGCKLLNEWIFKKKKIIGKFICAIILI